VNGLKDNPLGLTLAAIGGVCVLLMLAMAIVWSLPEVADFTEIKTEDEVGSGTVLAAHQIAAINEFQIINEKPLFNESRLPVMESADGDEVADDNTVAVKDAPDVRLTGVIITPELKIASLTPANTSLETVMLHEGQALTGDFVGWQVSTVNPRAVTLESRDGQKLELELQVHDSKIAQPPKPSASQKTAEAEPGEGEQAAGEDGQPLSRAEQIRLRIAERREQLRREQEEQQAQSGANRQNYQSAIRNLMKNKRKDQGSNDKEEG
jgi:hypothetical protein